MFGDIVLGVDRERFSDALDAEKRTLGIERDPDVDAETWKRLVVQFKAIIREAAGREFPQDAHEQLRLAVAAVFDSWNSRRAIDYRRYQ